MTIPTFEQLKYVLSTFSTQKEMAAYLGMGVKTFRAQLKEAGLYQSRATRYPEVDRAWLEEHWARTNKSIRALSKEYQIPQTLLEGRIDQLGIKKPLRYQLNVEKLFDVTDPHIWYLAGLLNADGYFPKNFDGFTIELVGEDELQLLTQINSYYESNFVIKSRINHMRYSDNPQQIYYLKFATPGLQAFFEENFNIVCREKTFCTSTPDTFPNEDCAKAYIRGCLDGDGYISKDCRTVAMVTASEKFITGVARIVNSYTGIPGRISWVKRSGGRTFPRVGWRTNKAKAVLAWVYSLENCFKLERKYLRYIENCKK